MATLTFNRFNIFALDFGKGLHQFHAAGHTLKLALDNNAPPVSQTILGNLTEVSGGNGYNSGGQDIQNDYVQSGATGLLTGVGFSWVASGGPIGPFRYLILNNSSIAGGRLIGWWDRGSSLTLNSGDSYTVSFSGSIMVVG